MKALALVLGAAMAVAVFFGMRSLEDEWASVQDQLVEGR